MAGRHYVSYDDANSVIEQIAISLQRIADSLDVIIGFDTTTAVTGINITKEPVAGKSILAGHFGSGPDEDPNTLYLDYITPTETDNVMTHTDPPNP